MSGFPISFWVVVGVLIAGGIWSFRRIKDGTGIPMLAVIGTVTAWYVGDVFYNDYGIFLQTFKDSVLQNAWWEVAWFLIVFLVAAPYVNRWFNARYLRQQSGVYQLARFGVDQPSLQRQLDILFIGCAFIYAILVLVAAIRIKGEMYYFFFPYLGYKPQPWGRGRIGTGFDAALSFAEYVQMMVSAVFGVMAAVSTNRRTRYLALLLCFIAWPYYLFDRTRNYILAVILPAILTWVFLRLRGSLLKKIAILGACYLVLSAWMAFIIENRSGGSIANAFKERGFNFKRESSVHHEGLNMYEELCWINTFIEKGTYNPNWGARYFAELANPIPRALWHNKPLIGIDYAIARGQGVKSANDGGDGSGGVYATISTGMIGQGVVNFGTILGPAAAALLMSFWVAVLARLDLNISKLGRLPLYALGLILTFNLGRDITLITLYPFVFGTALLWWLDRHPPRVANPPAPNPSAGSPAAGLPGGRPIQRRVRRVGIGLRPHRRPGSVRRS
jgi:oligosaccharide repeat unit polymerase